MFFHKPHRDLSRFRFSERKEPNTSHQAAEPELGVPLKATHARGHRKCAKGACLHEIKARFLVAVVSHAARLIQYRFWIWNRYVRFRLERIEQMQQDEFSPARPFPSLCLWRVRRPVCPGNESFASKGLRFLQPARRKSFL